MAKIVRTHDRFYANEPAGLVKQSFMDTIKLIQSENTDLSTQRIVDIGCATGEFPNYLQETFPSCKVVGIEFLQDLYEIAKKRYPNVTFQIGDICNSNTLEKQSVDIITVMGVISIFDELDIVVSNLCNWVKAGGKIYLHSIFNPFPIDVFVKYRHAASSKNKDLEAGWNIISQETITNLFMGLGAKSCNFHKFTIQEDILRNEVDPVRSWTEKMEDGSRQIVNGLHLRQPQFIMEVTF